MKACPPILEQWGLQVGSFSVHLKAKKGNQCIIGTVTNEKERPYEINDVACTVIIETVTNEKERPYEITNVACTVIIETVNIGKENEKNQCIIIGTLNNVKDRP